jgi:hypothetical protein
MNSPSGLALGRRNLAEFSVDLGQSVIGDSVGRVLLGLLQRHVAGAADLLTFRHLREVLEDDRLRGGIVEQIANRRSRGAVSAGGRRGRAESLVNVCALEAVKERSYGLNTERRDDDVVIIIHHVRFAFDPG